MSCLLSRLQGWFSCYSAGDDSKTLTQQAEEISERRFKTKQKHAIEYLFNCKALYIWESGIICVFWTKFNENLLKSNNNPKPWIPITYQIKLFRGDWALCQKIYCCSLLGSHGEKRPVKFTMALPAPWHKFSGRFHIRYNCFVPCPHHSAFTIMLLRALTRVYTFIQ